jgi:hypothetical protein
MTSQASWVAYSVILRRTSAISCYRSKGGLPTRKARCSCNVSAADHFARSSEGTPIARCVLEINEHPEVAFGAQSNHATRDDNHILIERQLQVYDRG